MSAGAYLRRAIDLHVGISISIICSLLSLLSVAPTLAQAQSSNIHEQWNEFSEGVSTQVPVAASQLSLKSLVLTRASNTVAPVDFRLSLPNLDTLTSSTTLVKIREQKEGGYYLTLKGSKCASSQICEFHWNPTSDFNKKDLQARDLWILASGKAVGDPEGEDLWIPACLCASSDLPSQDTVRFVLVPLRSINYTYEIFEPGGKVIQQQKRSGWPANTPIEISLPVSTTRGRYRLVLHHVATEGSTVETLDDAFSFIAP